jgi:translation elongation factor EF-4
VTELGIMHPEELPTTSLQSGQVGYIACNMKNSSEGAKRTYHTVFF